MNKLRLAKIRAEQGAREPVPRDAGTDRTLPWWRNREPRRLEGHIGFFSDRAEHHTELGHAQATRFCPCRAPKLLEEASGIGKA